MKCVCIAGVGFFLVVVVTLALLPVLMPAPIGGSGVASAATHPVTVSDIQFTANTNPSAVTLAAEKPQVVGRLYVNAQGKVAFQGDADASAKAFLNAVNRQTGNR